MTPERRKETDQVKVLRYAGYNWAADELERLRAALAAAEAERDAAIVDANYWHECLAAVYSS